MVRDRPVADSGGMCIEESQQNGDLKKKKSKKSKEKGLNGNVPEEKLCTPKKKTHKSDGREAEITDGALEGTVKKKKKHKPQELKNSVEDNQPEEGTVKKKKKHKPQEVKNCVEDSQPEEGTIKHKKKHKPCVEENTVEDNQSEEGTIKNKKKYKPCEEGNTVEDNQPEEGTVKKKKKHKSQEVKNCVEDSQPEEGTIKNKKKHKPCKEENTEDNQPEEETIKKKRKHKPQEIENSVEDSQLEGGPVKKKKKKVETQPEEVKESKKHKLKDSHFKNVKPKKKKSKHGEDEVVVEESLSEEVVHKKKKKHKRDKEELPDNNNTEMSPVNQKDVNLEAETEEKTKKRNRYKHLRVVKDDPVEVKNEVSVKSIPARNDEESNVVPPKAEPKAIIPMRKARHPGREARKLLKARRKAEGTYKVKAVKKKKKRKKKKDVAVTQDNKRKRGAILDEDKQTLEVRAKDFLNVWNTDKSNWKFVKTRQNWLVHHMYNHSKIDDDTFEMLLRYVSGMKGLSREETVNQAKNVLEVSSGANIQLHKRLVLTGKPGELQQTRARQVLQLL